MRHRIKHHVNRPVLHMGLFTDSQIVPAAGLLTLGAGWLYAGAGALVVRALVAAVVLLPVGIMVVDNRVGGIVVQRTLALLRWHRRPGIFAPGADNACGYALAVDEQDLLVLERESRARVDLETVFAHDG